MSAGPPAKASSLTHALAVDDDPSVRQMIADYLGDNEIQVTARQRARNRRGDATRND